MKLENKTIWITGASSGVGEGMATVFHREGADIIISGRREAELERVKASCTGGPGHVTLVPFDIIDAAAREDAARSVLGQFDRIDVLVNNAGIGQRSLAKDTTLEVDRHVMEVDFFGPLALTKLVLPQMIEQHGGHLVVTSSVAGKYAVPFHSTYSAAKHALHGYFDTLRIEHLKDNITITLLVIAGVKSQVYEHALTGDGSEYGKNPYGSTSGMTAEVCAERVVEAIEGLTLKNQDLTLFTERMAETMEWMAKQ
jgi:NADP-dependent 3-hydroxy acid dehydrogenase YdfG